MDKFCGGNIGNLGKRGEEIALEYLLQQGMTILARNWRCGHKELDIVADDGRFVRIVEVRSRCYPSAILPYESIGPAKRRKVLLAAKGFVQANSSVLKGREIVFDVVSIVFNGDLFKLEYMKEAFGPAW